MSGGMWNYLSNTLEDRADELRYAGEAFKLLAIIEHELDWGASADTCYDCAKLRVIAALETFFNDHATNAMAAAAVARDDHQNRCPKCEEREVARKATQ